MGQKRKNILINVTIVFILAALYAGLFIYVSYNNKKPIYIAYLSDNDICNVQMELTKSWPEESHGFRYGIQYDATIFNLTDDTLHSWVAYITVPDGSRIDSYWSGDFVCQDNQITVKPVDYNTEIESKDIAQFGFILYSDIKSNIQNFDVQIYRQLSVVNMSFFWILVAATLLWAFVCSVFVISDVKTRRILAQKQKYVDIVNESFLTFANMIDAKDTYTKGHSQRVAIYSRELARRLGMTEDEQWRIFYIALLHDIGKIGTKDAILTKNGKLTPDERTEIEQHVKVGGDILKDFSAIEEIEAGARYHHERFDGEGYVSHMKGTEIPFVARIICVADAFDAMTSERCYRPSLPIDVVKAELLRCAGSQFDPNIVPHMIHMIEEGFAPVHLEEDALRKELKQDHI